MSKYEKFSMETVSRKSLKGADYNPRLLSNQAKARLKRGIVENGLVQPIIWNRHTGNVVGGHQRLKAIDDLEGNDDYTLQVAVVDMPLAQERKVNVLLNNDSTMGHWDESKLLEILGQDGEEQTGVDYEAFGFSANQAEYYTNLMQRQELENAAIVAAMQDVSDLEVDVYSADTDNSQRERRHADKLEVKRRYEEQVSSLLTTQKNDEWKLKTDEEKKAYDTARNNFRNESFDVVSLRINFDSVASKSAFLARYNSPMKDVIHESELGEDLAGLAAAGRDEALGAGEDRGAAEGAGGGED
jgi:hypothetical protein